MNREQNQPLVQMACAVCDRTFWRHGGGVCACDSCLEDLAASERDIREGRVVDHKEVMRAIAAQDN